jgi:micrococcal nuclease
MKPSKLLQLRRFRGRRPTPLTIAVIVVVVLIAIREAAQRLQPGGASGTSQTVTIRRVIDGDTFVLEDGRRVRMLGIDSPEMGFGDKTAERYSQESTDWLKREIEGDTVRLEFESRLTDRYGRTLAWVYDGEGVLVNQLSLELGMSRLLDAYGLPLELEPQLRQAAASGRINRVGLWSK